MARQKWSLPAGFKPRNVLDKLRLFLADHPDEMLRPEDIAWRAGLRSGDRLYRLCLKLVYLGEAEAAVLRQGFLWKSEPASAIEPWRFSLGFRAAAGLVESYKSGDLAARMRHRPKGRPLERRILLYLSRRGREEGVRLSALALGLGCGFARAGVNSACRRLVKRKLLVTFHRGNTLYYRLSATAWLKMQTTQFKAKRVRRREYLKRHRKGRKPAAGRPCPRVRR